MLLENDAYLETKDEVVERCSRGLQRAGTRLSSICCSRGDADLGSKNNEGWTPLSWAAESGNEAVVKLLLEKGADLELKDEGGRAPLSWAAERGHKAIVKLLIEKGASLERRQE